MTTSFIPKTAAILALALIFGVSSTLAGTGLKNGMHGKKNIVLNNKVGENISKFISAAPLEEIKGTANNMSGTFILDVDNLEASRGNILVEVKSMQTGVASRDNHMIGKDWLDAETYPTITFELTGLQNVQILKDDNVLSEIRATAVGTFTMHGESKEISAPVSIKYVKESAATKQRADGDLAMVSGTFQVALKDFKVKGAGGIVGKKVGEVIQIELSLFGATGR